MVLGHRRHSNATGSARTSHDDTRGEVGEDETVVDAEQGNVLGHIISQLRPGADLSRVTLPTFILEPRSMLERITNFMAHADTLLPMPAIDDPVNRFVAVVRFYLSGWHIRPPGVKKPLNPILGETFTGYWDYPDDTRGYYISERTSHHPPKSSYFFMVPEHFIRIDGTLKPRSKFLGNSAASMMEGLAVMRFLNRNERYFVTQPNMYARGILFGKMKYELGDHSLVKCPETNLVADLEFKTKGYFGGTYNAIGGFIKEISTDKKLFELSGHWHGEMFITDLSTGKKELLYDATHAEWSPPLARPIEEQEERSSQRLWAKVNTAIKKSDHHGATDEKSLIENQQRQEAAQRAEEEVEWSPRIFRAVRGGPGGSEEGEEDLDWVINAEIDGKTPEEQIQQILAIAPIIPGQKVQSPAILSSESQSDLSATTGSVPVTAAAGIASGVNGNSPHNVESQHEQVQPQPITNGAPFNPQELEAKRQAAQDEALLDVLAQPATPPLNPPSQLVASMQRLEVGEPKKQAAEFDPHATPRQQPVQHPHGALQPEVPQLQHRSASPGAIVRMDSQTSEPDIFHDAKS